MLKKLFFVITVFLSLQGCFSNTVQVIKGRIATTSTKEHRITNEGRSLYWKLGEKNKNIYCKTTNKADFFWKRKEEGSTNEVEISNSTSNYKVIENSDKMHSTLVVEEVFENTRAFYVCEAIQDGLTLKVDSKDEILVRVYRGNEFLIPMYGILAQAFVIFLFSLYFHLKRKRKTSLVAEEVVVKDEEDPPSIIIEAPSSVLVEDSESKQAKK